MYVSNGDKLDERRDVSLPMELNYQYNNTSQDPATVRYMIKTVD